MTYRSFWTARLVLFAFALVAAGAVSACTGTPCKLSCGNAGAYVKLPANADLETATVTTAPPCMAQLAREQDGLQTFVYSPNAGTCQVRVQLMNGETYAFSVTFESFQFSCCGTIVHEIDASVPELISTRDGGAD